MKLKWKLAALKNGLQDATAYRIEFLFEILGSAFVPAAIQLILWYAIFEVGHVSEIGGMNHMEVVHYTLVSILFSQVRGGDHDFELQEMIRTGQLSNYLLRPVSVIEFIYIRGVASRLLIATFCLFIGVGLSVFIGFPPERMLGAMLLALIGNVIHYQLGTSLASAAFYWEDAYSVLMVKNMVVSILSGEMIPLNIFPPSMQWIWRSTPFYLYVFGPTQYALGNWSHSEFLYHLGIAGLWLLFGYLAIKVTWGLGLKKYLSLGG